MLTVEARVLWATVAAVLIALAVVCSGLLLRARAHGEGHRPAGAVLVMVGAGAGARLA